MATGKEQLEVDDDFNSSDSDDSATPVENTKASLSKRRTIDNLLEERRLQRQLADYDFDL